MTKTSIPITVWPDAIIPASGLPDRVLAGQTTRQPLDPTHPSHAPFDSFNLALHVGDDPRMVQQQRMTLLQTLAPYGAKRLAWLEQTHSTQVHAVTGQPDFFAPCADAMITRQVGVACMIMTADCLPIVLSNSDGSEVACIHAGWRGLLNGVIETTAKAMQTAPVYAWLGAAIGDCHFEVGDDVRAAFMAQRKAAQSAFTAQSNGKYLADLYALARQRLSQLGVTYLNEVEHCSYQQQTQYYSYRRSAITGRMATFVMIQPD